MQLASRKDGRLLTKKESQLKKMANIKSTLNGGAVVTMMQTVVKRQSWLMNGGIKEEAKLLLMTGFSGTLSTRINQTRGRHV